MMHYQMSSCDASPDLIDRKLSSQQRDDEESASSLPNSTTMTQCRGRDAKSNRRSVFDDMYNHFGSQRVDPTGKINSSLAPPGSDEMCFGDLDFDADAAAFDFEEYDPTPNEQPASIPTESILQPYLLNRSKDDCALSISQNRNDASSHDEHMKLRLEDCERAKGRRS